MKKGPEYVGRLIGAIVALGLYLLLTGCSSFRLATMQDDMYPVDYVIAVNSDTKIDTLSYSQVRWKLRTDFSFRWNYAQYAMNQPYNWYSSFSYNIWRPYNSFDVYFNRYDFWYDWAFNYPYYWGYSSWHNPWRQHWYRPYSWAHSWYDGPFYNSSYNAIWNSSRENVNIAYVRGHRGSRTNSIIPLDNNIENNIIRRYNSPRDNVDNNNLNNIVNKLRDEYGIKPRVYNNPNNFNNDQINGLNIRTNQSTEGSNNGGRSWSGENIPVKPIRTWQPPTSQSGQIRGGSGSSGIQQSRSGGTSSGQGGRGSSGRKN
tara:strand:+ start:336 stop:1280 length:945 start_codon:yes stop_codon:yes gene_type:complete